MFTYDDQKTVSTREFSWAKAGQSFDTGGGLLTDAKMTATEAMEKVGMLDWNVRHVPLTTGFGDHAEAVTDSGLIVPDRYATVATIKGEPKVLGDVGKRHTVFQNEQVADLMQNIVDDGGLNVTAAGTLDNDRKTFMVMEVPGGFNIGGEDAHGMFLGATNAHDGSGSLVVWVTAMRLACTNAIKASIRDAKATWRLRHTSGIEGRVQQARESLNLTFKWMSAYEKQSEELLREPFSNAMFDRLLDRLEPESESEHEGWIARQDEKRDTLRYLFTKAETNEFGRGTKYAAFNAFTEYADWYMPIKGDDAEGTKRAARVLDSTTVDNYKQRTLDALVAA